MCGSGPPLQGAFAPGGDPLASANRSAGVRQAARIPCKEGPLYKKCRVEITINFARLLMIAQAVASLDEQRAGTAGWVADAVAGLRADQFGDEFRHFRRGVYSPAFLPALEANLPIRYSYLACYLRRVN
jgi:hypothetical protein